MQRKTTKRKQAVGPLEELLSKSRHVLNHCQMCGADSSHLLEPAFNPSGRPMILCQACRIGSAECLAAQRTESTAGTKPTPIIFVEGGIVQDVILPIPSGDKPYINVEYDLVDYDVFDGNPDADIAEYWSNREPATQQYIRTHCQDEYRRFRKAIDRHTRAQRKAKK